MPSLPHPERLAFFAETRSVTRGLQITPNTPRWDRNSPRVHLKSFDAAQLLPSEGGDCLLDAEYALHVTRQGRASMPMVLPASIS
jgi:hypothetical protein